jgi:hypothetical protein
MLTDILDRTKGEHMLSTQDNQLTKQDRCDRCGSQAYVHVVLPSGNDLMFCGHHWKVNKDKISSLEHVLIQDELFRLTDHG